MLSKIKLSKITGEPPKSEGRAPRVSALDVLRYLYKDIMRWLKRALEGKAYGWIRIGESCPVHFRVGAKWEPISNLAKRKLQTAN